MCKKRHIRCDEHFPQWYVWADPLFEVNKLIQDSRNFSKHSVRCDYMDVSQAGEEPVKGTNPPELLTSPELQQALDNWRLTGQPPLAELRKSEASYWTRF